MTDAYKQLVFSILEFLQDVSNGPLKIEGLDTESLEVATQCLSSTFDVDLNNEDHKKYSIRPLTLPGVFALGLAGKEQLSNALAQQLSGLTTASPASSPSVAPANPPVSAPMDPLLEAEFNSFVAKLHEKNYFGNSQPGTPEYQARLEKAKAGFLSKAQQSKQDVTEQAEKLKNEGNTLLPTNPTKACELYTKAIELNPNNAIYYCNRAAALCKLGKYEEAVKDGLMSQQKDPNYSKAWGRLGFAYLALNKLEEAEKNYLQALKLDPNNPTYQDALEEIGNRRAGSSGTPSAGSAPGAGSVPGAGNFDFASLLNNPMLRQMGQQFAQQAQQGQPASTPAGASPGGAFPRGTSPGGGFPGGGFPAGGMPGGGIPGAGIPGGAGGGNPLAGLENMDFGSLMNNPNIMNMASSLMQNPEFSQMAQNLMANPDALNQMMGAFMPPGAGKK
eukprot:TRINITY_DN4871_c0_g1_i1.p1 TRINITY_DN4871_c0_g1~~TRINITY_DN4871_c0_g1_i1.p1  ORF type:complete len:457 (+),score=123.42 TRINITY_DN4871_c0_g1_i1:36-1373(+)